MTIEQTRHLMQLNQRPPVRMVRGKGSSLWDEQGRRYLDFIQGWAVNCLGHSPDVLIAAVTRQLNEVINVGPAYNNVRALELAQRLADRSGLSRVFLASSGLEANEAAVKLARKWGQKHKGGAYEIITTFDGFHGRSLALTSATGKPGWDRAFPPAIEGFPKVPFGDLEAVERAIGPRTVAVMVEPIQGEAGAVVPKEGYLAGLRALCDRFGILLIADEIQTGMARTGPLFAHQHDGITPDLMSLGKGLGGGIAISALLAREEVACFDAGDHGGTFSGNALACSAALCVLDVLTNPEHTALRSESSRYLEATLRTIASSTESTLRGRGHLWGLVLRDHSAAQIRDQAFERGLLLNAARPDVLRFMPALDVSRDVVDAMADILLDVMR